MPLYFAYGSNMDQAAMGERCPASRPLGRARLPRHRLVIMPAGYASVSRDPRDAVWGLLWDLALADVSALDRYEGVASGLYRKVLQQVVTDAGPRRALVYLGKGEGGVSRPGYLESVIAAARAGALPDDYVARLASLLSRGATSEARPPLPQPRIRPTRSSPLEPIRPLPAWSWEP